MPQHGSAPGEVPFCVGGDVTLAEDVTIAPGVVLEAVPGSRLVVESQVCIGAGTIIQARQGELRLAQGANLATGVLVIGRGYIGSYACVGADSTLLNPALAEAQVVPARSLWGDVSRSLQSPAPEQDIQTEMPPDPWAAEPASTDAATAFKESAPAAFSGAIQEQQAVSDNGAVAASPATPPGESAATNTNPPETERSPDDSSEAFSSQDEQAQQNGGITQGTAIYGREQVDQLLQALFPHRKSLDSEQS